MKKIGLGLLIILVFLAGCSPGAEPVSTDKNLPIYSVDREDKKLAISFDAAWGIDYTEELLGILDQYGIKTTFFVVQFWVEDYPDMARMIVNRGHEIGNHSASHPQMGSLSAEQIEEEIMSTHQTIVDITGFEPFLFRPPFGHYSDCLLDTMEALGYYTIQWDVDSLDWKERGVEDIVQRVISKAGPGSIILFHNNAKYIAQALPLLLDYFAENDLQVVPISKLIYRENFHIDHEGRQRKK